MSPAAKSSGRMQGVDAARGMAMVFSCLAHFAWWLAPAAPFWGGVLSDIGKVATPTFLLFSGTMTGWMCSRVSGDPQRTRYKLLNRGLFLLTAGHLLISLAEAHREGSLLVTVARATIIDDIGLSMLVAVVVFGLLQDPAFRLKLAYAGVTGFLACWAVILVWHPTDPTLIALHQALLAQDPLGMDQTGYSSPSLQYVCLYAIGIGVSDRLVASATASTSPGLAFGLMRWGAGMMFVALMLRALRSVLDRGALSMAPGIDATLAITGKTPPSPVYILFFGGAGLVLSAVLFRVAANPGRAARAVVSPLVTVGRASLFIFVLQYYVFWTLPDIVGIPPGRDAWAVFPLGLLGIWGAATCWNRLGLNRWLTLGIHPR